MSDSFFAAEGSLSGSCRLCPRRCGADRTRDPGFCGAGAEMGVARIMLHHWEEPPISGPDPTDEAHGSGAHVERATRFQEGEHSRSTTLSHCMSLTCRGSNVHREWSA